MVEAAKTSMAEISLLTVVAAAAVAETGAAAATANTVTTIHMMAMTSATAVQAGQSFFPQPLAILSSSPNFISLVPRSARRGLFI